MNKESFDGYRVDPAANHHHARHPRRALGEAHLQRPSHPRHVFKNAFAQIDAQLRRRFDLIPDLVEPAKGDMSHERETLEAVTAAVSHDGRVSIAWAERLRTICGVLHCPLSPMLERA